MKNTLFRICVSLLLIFISVSVGLTQADVSSCKGRFKKGGFEIPGWVESFLSRTDFEGSAWFSKCQYQVGGNGLARYYFLGRENPVSVFAGGKYTAWSAREITTGSDYLNYLEYGDWVSESSLSLMFGLGVDLNFLSRDYLDWNQYDRFRPLLSGGIDFGAIQRDYFDYVLNPSNPAELYRNELKDTSKGLDAFMYFHAEVGFTVKFLGAISPFIGVGYMFSPSPNLVHERQGWLQYHAGFEYSMFF